MTTTEGVDYSVSSNGRTVWVNGKECCIARFCCPCSYEIMNPEGKWETHLCRDFPSLQDAWERFVKAVKLYQKIDVHDAHKPLGVK